ncbi:MAG: hypothetical protein ACK4MM_03335 [Fervidobacterium sp.]
MTLVKVKQREVAVQQEQVQLGFLKYTLPIVFLFVTILGSYILNIRATQLLKEVEQYRNNVAAIEQQHEIMNMQIKKLLVGRDVVN